jgi:hypothetical protein
MKYVYLSFSIFANGIECISYATKLAVYCSAVGLFVFLFVVVFLYRNQTIEIMNVKKLEEQNEKLRLKQLNAEIKEISKEQQIFHKIIMKKAGNLSVQMLIKKEVDDLNK